jgi:hypothetical protein
MVAFTLNEAESVLHVRPSGPLRKEDFSDLARAVDPYIERTGGLKGLILETADFPGWSDLKAFVGHIRFVRDHHREIGRVAFVTDSSAGKAAEHIAAHFVSAEIKKFDFDALAEAKAWVARGEVAETE